MRDRFSIGQAIANAIAKRQMTTNEVDSIFNRCKSIECVYNSFSDKFWLKLSLPYNEFDVFVSDINYEGLVEIGLAKDIEHLSSGTFESPAFPVTGLIHGGDLRYMVPLICQRPGFLVDTSSPFTCHSVKSLECRYGEGNATHSLFYMAIQHQTTQIVCEVSKGHFAEVNILGANAMQHLKLQYWP